MLTPDEILALAADLESERVERKRGPGSPHRFRETVCAMANDMANSRQTGYILVGIEDNGNLADVIFNDQQLCHLSNIRDSGHVLPLPDIRVYKVEMAPGAEVAVVEVAPHPQPPVRFEGPKTVASGSYARSGGAREPQRPLRT